MRELPLADIDFGAWARFFGRYAGMAIAFFVVVSGSMWLWMRAVAKPQRALAKDLVGTSGTALTEISGLEGRVKIGEKEIRAISDDKIRVGSAIRILEVDGLIAKVAEQK